jgi:hypothetical protein
MIVFCAIVLLGARTGPIAADLTVRLCFEWF